MLAYILQTLTFLWNSIHPIISTCVRSLFKFCHYMYILFCRIGAPYFETPNTVNVSHVFYQGTLYKYSDLYTEAQFHWDTQVPPQDIVEIRYTLKRKKYRLQIPTGKSVNDMFMLLCKECYRPTTCDYILYAHIVDRHTKIETDVTQTLNTYAGPDGTFHSLICPISYNDLVFNNTSYSDESELFWIDHLGKEHIVILLNRTKIKHS